MSKELLDETSLLPYQSEEIRSSIAKKIKTLRSQFRILPMQFDRFNQNLAEELREMWKEENSLYISELSKKKKRETALKRLDRWKGMVKRYRKYALLEASKRWYSQLRSMRSELALVVAMYQYSEIERIPITQQDWKADLLETMSPVVLRIKGPRKPSKKKILIRDLEYDIGDAYLEMMQPLTEWMVETKNKIDNLTAPRKKLKYETKVKRFREAVIAREHLTILTQSLAPRQGSLQLKRDIESDETDDLWMQVFE